MISVFHFLDVDGSGELEEDEVMDVLGQRQRLGQAREEKAKQDAKDFINKNLKRVTMFMKDLTGF
jgi:uncharacterized protein YjbI with pentapeptide repeats